MQFDHLTTAVFSEALALVEERQALELKLAKVDADLLALQTGKISKQPAEKAAKPVKAIQARVKPVETRPVPAPAAAKPGKIKDRVLAILEAAGTGGVAVSDLAATLQIAPANLHVWFATTGKKDPSIQKVGRGRYAWKKSDETSDVGEPAEIIEVPQPPPAPLPVESFNPATPEPAPPEAAPAPVETEPLVVEETPKATMTPENVEQQELLTSTPEEA